VAISVVGGNAEIATPSARNDTRDITKGHIIKLSSVYLNEFILKSVASIIEASLETNARNEAISAGGSRSRDRFVPANRRLMLCLRHETR
jgi:hypothetical protein